MNDLGRRNKFTVLRVPGHVGLEGNEELDELARKGAATALVGPEPLCGLRDICFKGKSEMCLFPDHILR